MKTERIDMMSLVFGVIFLFLAAIFTYSGFFSWPGLSCYTGGLILIFLSLSYMKYKVYAKYIVPTLLVSGATIAVLGWFLLPPLTTLRILTTATGISVFTGGLANLIVSFGGKRELKETVL